MSDPQRPSYQQCRACNAVAYLPRKFCPVCGSLGIDQREAEGSGMVRAVTRVHRAPTPEFEAVSPYTLCLVESLEGFRLMTHGEAGLAIGEPVSVRLEMIAGRLLPYASRAGPDHEPQDKPVSGVAADPTTTRTRTS
jgi:uncharacterized OB-fold protein